MKNEKLRLVEVEWYDTAAIGGSWGSIAAQRRETNREALLHCRSVGYLLRSDKSVVVLAQNWNSDGQCADLVVIPRGTIKRVRRLRR